MLEKLDDLDIKSWRYNGEDPSIRHVGPTAQDLYAAFGLGKGNDHITTVDADGIALAAIKALREQNLMLIDRVDELERKLAAQW